MVANKYINNILSINKVNDRLMSIRLAIGAEIWTVISAYAPQTGCDQSEKEAFWANLMK